MKKTLALIALIAFPAFAQTAATDAAVPTDETQFTPMGPADRPHPPGPPGYRQWTCYSSDQWNRWFAATSWNRNAAAQGSVDYCYRYNPFGACYFRGCEVR